MVIVINYWIRQKYVGQLDQVHQHNIVGQLKKLKNGEKINQLILKQVIQSNQHLRKEYMLI